MEFIIKNELILRRLLYSDAFIGSFTGIFGLVFATFLSKLVGINHTVIVLISIITFCYSILASFLAFSKKIDIRYTRILILANWIWSGISIFLLYLHYDNATLVGKSYLILQVIAVAGLAYLEGSQIIKQSNTHEV